MTDNPWAVFRSRRILLLQGPVGPFFRQLSAVLTGGGAQIQKVNFNGGDCLFYPDRAIHWRGRLEDWPQYFASLLDRFEIELVVLFGDCRPMHRMAREIANRRGVKVGAFEEGYIRPNFITFEQDGVNGYSFIPRAPECFPELLNSPSLPENNVGNTFWYAALWAVMYYLAAAALRPWFRHYRHHRSLALTEAWPWLRAGWRKAFYACKEHGLLEFLTGPLSKKFFLVPLQMASDSQVFQHSGFKTVEHFIRTIVVSFAANAPHDTTLVVKHHPLDRGYHDYRHLLSQLARTHNLGDRLLYIHDQRLPALFEQMRGAVVINSTVGFSALSHGAAVKTCGRAIYDIEGLTFQGSLDEFWGQAAAFRIDTELFKRFRAYVLLRTQINGSFYKGGIDAKACASMTSSIQVTRARPSARSVTVDGLATRSPVPMDLSWNQTSSPRRQPILATEE